MSKKLEPCPFCESSVKIHLTPKVGIPSGDDGWQAEIMCQCHAGMKFWALKKSWAEDALAKAWNSRAATEANEALTLEELRGMDGEPVWLHTFSAVQKKTNISQWAILETIGEASAIFLRAGVNTRTTKYFCTYGNRWLAYRRPPEGGAL